MSSRQYTRPSTGVPKMFRNPSSNEQQEAPQRFRVTSSNKIDSAFKTQFRPNSPETTDTATLLKQNCESLNSTNYIQSAQPFEKTATTRDVFYRRKRTMHPQSVDKLSQSQPYTSQVSPRSAKSPTHQIAASTRYAAKPVIIRPHQAT